MFNNNIRLQLLDRAQNFLNTPRICIVTMTVRFFQVQIIVSNFTILFHTMCEQQSLLKFECFTVNVLLTLSLVSIAILFLKIMCMCILSYAKVLLLKCNAIHERKIICLWYVCHNNLLTLNIRPITSMTVRFFSYNHCIGLDQQRLIHYFI